MMTSAPNAYDDPDDVKPDDADLMEWLTDHDLARSSFKRIHHGHILHKVLEMVEQYEENGAAFVEIAPGDSTRYYATLVDRHVVDPDKFNDSRRWVMSFGTDSGTGMVVWGKENHAYMPVDSLIGDLVGPSHHGRIHSRVVAWVWLSYLLNELGGETWHSRLPWLRASAVAS